MPDNVEIDFDAYQKIQSLKIAGITLFMGWNPDDPKRTYLLYNKQSTELGNYYTDAIASEDYLSIAQLYSERLQAQIKKAREHRKERNLPIQMLDRKHCLTRGENESLEGKLVVLDPQRLAPEYRTADCQLVIAMGGFGCESNARGRAVFVKELYSGEQFRVDNGDVLGIADFNRLPDWIDEKLLERQREMKEGKQPLSKRKEHGGEAR